jgi:hypothetical protein
MYNLNNAQTILEVKSWKENISGGGGGGTRTRQVEFFWPKLLFPSVGLMELYLLGRFVELCKFTAFKLLIFVPVKVC